MLQVLHVKNIALIDDVEIEFSDGLNILTGETGAGKSILIDSVNFALGGKVSKDMIRDNADYALSELVFNVEDEETLLKLNNMDIFVQDNQVILQRRIANNKTTCKCNGETVPASVLKEIASLLIDIHGQHEHHSLTNKNNHRILLDEFCGTDLTEELCKLKIVYNDFKNIDKELEEALASDGDKQKDLDYAEFVVNEIDSANLKIDEDDELEKEYARMNNSRKLSESLMAVRGAMSSDGEGASSFISYAVSEMKHMAAIDEGCEELYDQLKDIEGLVQDFNRGLYSYGDALEFSQEEYVRVENRLNEINRLKSKYGRTIEDVLSERDSKAKLIEKLNDFDAYLQNLQCKHRESYDILRKVCEKISQIRKKEALILEKDIVSALNNLNFLDAKFEISVIENHEKITVNGYDDVEFMISTNPGEAIKPLTMVASGGELSRIMLALKSVLAKRDAIGTLIFDEIDTGISGKTAQRVADRMSDIAKGHQVICITHLPQIASHADSHFLIEKSVEGTHTVTSVKKLSYDDSVEELSRMLAGESITDAVRENAIEMKKAAKINN